MVLSFVEERVRVALENAWSLETAAQWTEQNPALGQSNLTAVVVHDLFGAEILRTWLPDVWHYYNRINGKRVDLTDSQFHRPGALFEAPRFYQDEPATRTQAMNEIPEREYNALVSALINELAS